MTNNNRESKARTKSLSGKQPRVTKKKRSQKQPKEAEGNAKLCPQGHDYKEGEMIVFRAPLTSKILVGKVLYVRAPAQTAEGGNTQPTYWCLVAEEVFPRAVSPKDIIQEV